MEIFNISDISEIKKDNTISSLKELLSKGEK